MGHEKVTAQDIWQTGIDWLMEALREVSTTGHFRPPLTHATVVALHTAAGAALASLRDVPPRGRRTPSTSVGPS